MTVVFIASGSAANASVVIENGDRVFPCRCGQTHRGPYAFEDYAHHNCFHGDGLYELGPEDPGHFICKGCGMSFFTAEEQG